MSKIIEAAENIGVIKKRADGRTRLYMVREANAPDSHKMEHVPFARLDEWLFEKQREGARVFHIGYVEDSWG